MKNSLLKIFITLSLIFVFLLSSCAKKSRNVASDAFDALVSGDKEGFYELIKFGDHDELLSFESFEPLFDEMKLGEDYKVKKVSSLVWLAESDEGNVKIKLTPDESYLDPSPFLLKDATVTVPLGSKVSLNENELTSPTESTRLGDKYQLPVIFKGGKYNLEVLWPWAEGKVFGVNEKNLVITPDQMDISVECESELISIADSFVKTFYYDAQGAKLFYEIQDTFLSSIITDSESAALKEKYTNTSSKFAVFDERGNLLKEGIYDLLFTDCLANVSHNGENFKVNLTLDYSYQIKDETGEVQDVFEDIQLEVTLIFDGEKWGVVAFGGEEL